MDDKNQLLVLKNVLNYLQNNELSKSYLEEILKELFPKKNNELLINYNIKEKGIVAAQFIPNTKSIDISLNKVNIWLENNIKDFMKDYKVNDINVLKSYLFLLMISHEIEHSKQYLIAEGAIESPCVLLKDAYKGLFELFNYKESIIPRPIKDTKRRLSLFLYKLKENYYLLERNANIESMSLVSDSALYNNNEDIYKIFDDLKNIYLKCGYVNSTMGSIEETYRKILMYNKYKNFTHQVGFSDQDKIRYGLEITEEVRNKVLGIY